MYVIPVNHSSRADDSAIQETHLELFHSFVPQLCGRMNDASLENIAKAIGAPKEFIMEEKLDGERIQLHMRGNGAQWFYCSRKAKDYSMFFPTLHE